ncbi:MAG: hypothetical protein HY216_07385 [Candidatus Rokubacteria bacterium]|nr:hypothetical protein [Candidatus Rokubacteria bacterium]
MVVRGRSGFAAALVGLALVAVLTSAGAASLSLPAGIPPAERHRLQDVANAAAVSTHVEAEPFVTRPEVFEYLIDHPEFATHVTRALRLARYRIWRAGGELALDDGWGATGVFRVVHAGTGLRVMYARGEYNKALLPTINGEAVTIIGWDYTPAPGGRRVAHTTVAGYVKFDSRMMNLAVRATRVIAQRKADLEARRLMRTFARVSQAIEEDAGSVLERVRARPDVPQRELEEFSRLVNAR